MSNDRKVQKSDFSLGNIIIAVAISVFALSWLPVAEYQKSVIELPYFIAFAGTMAFPYLLYRYGSNFRISRVFIALLAWSAICVAAMALHGTPGGYLIPFQLIASAFLAWTLAILIARNTISLRIIGLVGNLVLITTIIISSYVSGINFFSELFKGVIGERMRLIRKVIKPMVNAFSSGFSDAQYTGVHINSIAAFLVVFSVLSFSREKGDDRFRPITFAVATFSIVLAFMLFSSSASLVIATFVILKFLQIALSYSPYKRFFIILAGLTLLPFYLNSFLEYTQYNITSDESNRVVREKMYAFAFDVIQDNYLFGSGYVLNYGFSTHNFILFSWMTGGIILLLICVLLYYLFISMFFRVLISDAANLPVYGALLAMIFVRTLVGGAGGVPNPPAIIALAVLAGLIGRRVYRQGRKSRAGRRPPGLMRSAAPRAGLG